MNYFAHGRRFLDDPYVLSGTAVPDWLNVVDRRVRVRAKGARLLLADENPHVANVARGIVQHHYDDDWFHQTRAFAELSWQFTVEIRDALSRNGAAADDGLRPSFLGHILVEMLLDAVLIEDDPEALRAYYESLDQIDAKIVQQTVNRIAKVSTDRLVDFMDLFRAHRFLFDYTDDDKLLFRLNQVMRRVKLAALPNSLIELFPDFRAAVRPRRTELLTPTNTPA